MSAAEETLTSNVVRTRIGVMTYLAPKGTLAEEGELEDLRAGVDASLDAWETHLVIDFTSVQVLTSPVLEALLDFQESLTRVGGWLKVAHVNPVIREIFQITGFDEIIGIMETGVSEERARVAEAEPVQSRRLGDILITRGLVSEKQIAEAVKLQNRLGKRLGQILTDKGWVSERNMLSALGEQLTLPFIRLRSGLYDPDVVGLLEKDVARRLKVLPLFKVRDLLSLATADPQAVPSLDEVEERTGCRVRPVLAQREDILKAINEAYVDSGYATDLVGDLDDDFEVVENQMPDDYAAIDELAAGSPVVNLVNSVIQRAVHDGASDIHIEPARSRSRVRFRIDGLLYEVMTPRLELHPAMVSRLKVMANLDISERRLPQDGRIQVHTQGRSVDLRFSSLPGLCGEKVVLRVLDKNQAILDVNKLGMNSMNLAPIKNCWTAATD